MKANWFILMMKKKQITPAKIHEHINNVYLQLLSNHNIPSTGWVNYEYKADKEVLNKERKTFCDKEVIVNGEDIIRNDKITDSISPCIVSFDLEVYSSYKNSFPKAENLEDCIFQISVVVQHPTGKIDKILFCLTNAKIQLYFKLEDTDCRFYVDEGEMITAYRDFLVKLKPHVIIGYNIMGFDLGYILQRDNDKHGTNATNNNKFQQHGFYKYSIR